jgi:protein ImuB
MYACLFQLSPVNPSSEKEDSAASARSALIAVAQSFSPRYESHGADLAAIDVSGLDRLLGPPQAIGEELRQACAERGLRAHVAVASTWTAAAILAHARAGLTVVPRGGEAEALAPIGIGILDTILPCAGGERARPGGSGGAGSAPPHDAIATARRWGIRTLGELAALPAADLTARLGRASLMWQALARGEDLRPLIPTPEAERFESSMELEWPVEELEPLSFVLTRLLEPLAVRLERRDRGAAVLHVVLRLVTKEIFARRLELPSPMRDVRTLRTLALLDLESHPAPAAIDRVAIVIEPTPGRVLQHTLYARAHPTPEQLSTLLARLSALMGQDRIGAPAVVDTDRPGAFAMTPFATEHDHDDQRGTRGTRRSLFLEEERPASNVVSAVRRCRQPVPARVTVGAGGRPLRVTTDRRSFDGGSVVACMGPWRTSGNWWDSGKSEVGSQKSEVWDRDEWDVSLNDGAVYRIFRDRASDGWFIDAIVD